MLQAVCIGYDSLRKMRMRYLMAIHQAPTDEGLGRSAGER